MLTKVIGSACLFAAIAIATAIMLTGALLTLFAFGWIMAVIVLSFAIVFAAVARDAFRRLAADWKYYRVLE